MYNFMCIILEAQVSFIYLFKNYNSFQKLVSDFGDLETLRGWKIRHKIALDANECETTKAGIHCKSGSWAMNRGLSISNEPSSLIMLSSPESETNFSKRMHNSGNMKETCASKIIPIKLYTHLLCATKI